ncbi:peptidylprolyl isomerase [Flavobacteriaceae bacterium GSB9]|nr:peptidylprolyl isomerase [Flavobacteriaceae bacterium GSB9]
MTNCSFVCKVLLLSLIIQFISCKAPYPELEDGMYAEFTTNKGIMVAKLEQEKTPTTVANFVSLAEGTNELVSDSYKNKKFYNGLSFHRVVPDFMIQGGDPNGDGSGNPGYRFDDEFTPSLKHNKKGILAMANSGYGTNGSQFYITHKATPWLDAYDDEGFLKNCEDRRVSCHTVFGEVVLGLEVIDSIKQNDTIQEIKIIRKGKVAKNFDAPEVFKNHFVEAERLEKEKKAKAEAILNKTKKKFEEQKAKSTTLESGLQYFVSKKGTGEKLPEDAEVLVHYAVYFENGKLLETSNLETAEALDAVNPRRKAMDRYQPITAQIGPDAGMIPGFKEGLKQLHVGDKATLFVPYHLAYGESGTRGIPGKSNLIFEVEIIELLK